MLPLLLLASGCCPRHLPPVEHTDSVRVEIRERLVRDTVSIEVPVEIERVVTRDTASRLENSYAVSEAVVSDGFLSHSLSSKPQTIHVPVTVTVHDTLWRESHEEQTVVEVERKLSKRESFLLGMGTAAVGAVIALLLLLIYKIVRRYA